MQPRIPTATTLQPPADREDTPATWQALFHHQVSLHVYGAVACQRSRADLPAGHSSGPSQALTFSLKTTCDFDLTGYHRCEKADCGNSRILLGIRDSHGGDVFEATPGAFSTFAYSGTLAAGSYSLFAGLLQIRTPLAVNNGCGNRRLSMAVEMNQDPPLPRAAGLPSASTNLLATLALRCRPCPPWQ